MTGIKLCGLKRESDIDAANALKPDYIGFVFAPKSKRYVTRDEAKKLKAGLSERISAVGVFVDEAPEAVAELLNLGIIDIAQLHGHEDDAYIGRLRELSQKPIIQAFRVVNAGDAARASLSAADFVLLDSGAGTGSAFDWGLIQGFGRPYFLAGGLSPQNVGGAVRALRPFAVDVSSGIETDGVKDKEKMVAFVAAVREADIL